MAKKSKNLMPASQSVFANVSDDSLDDTEITSKTVVSYISEEEYKAFEEGIDESTIRIPDVYQEIFLDNYRYFLLSSGRVSGKTSILVILWWASINAYPDRDIIFLQATSTEIKDSIINEIEKFLVNSGKDVSDDLSSEWYIPRSKQFVQWAGHRGKTYFYPITDSKGGQRSRGINTTNQVSLVLYEECQKNKDANVVEQSLITFIRQLDLNAKIVIVGNNETQGHWFIDFVLDKRKDPEWCYIYANCYDIWKLLNQQTRDYIENFRRANPTEFRRIFLGDVTAVTSDVVFPQFKRNAHYKKINELEQHYISTLFIGVDHATADDTFAVVPVAILDDGTTQTLEVMYNDPKETNVTLAPSEQCDLLDQFVNFLDQRYGIVSNRLQTVISIDGQASPFIAQVRHMQATSRNKVWKSIKIKGFTLKKKDVNLGVIKNAFAYNVLKILNEGQYQWDGNVNTHRLAREIERQRYKNHKLDPGIGNDLVDALEYALIPYYSNCYNLSFPVRYRNYMQTAHVNEIRQIARFNKAKIA